MKLRNHCPRFSHYWLKLLQVILFCIVIITVLTFKLNCFNSSEYQIKDSKGNGFVRINSSLDEEANDIQKGTIVIGILSNTENQCLREAQRKLFIPKAKTYKTMDVRVLFVLDERTEMLDEEQRINGDILFLNTSVRGWSNGFARKLHIWLRYAIANFPDALLIGRMDDDVFTCTPQIFDRLNQVKHELLYYGYPTGWPSPCTKDCIDEMFLVIGIELARRVARRDFCDAVNDTDCLNDGNGGHMFRHWINSYNDYVYVDEKANDKMIWFYFLSENKMEYKKYMTPVFCKKYLLYHKATPSEIYRWNQYNSLLLGDGLMANVSEKDIIDADTCPKNVSVVKSKTL